MDKSIMNEFTATEDTCLSSLTIGPEGKLLAPEGKVILMTVDHVLTDPVPGDYRGEIVLHVADSVTKIGEWENPYRSALYVDEKPIEEKSAPAAITGDLTDASLQGGSIALKGDCLNGITITSGDFAIDGTQITMDGRGADDFQLFGSAVAVYGKGKVTIQNTSIETKGVVSTALAAAGDSTVLVMNSKIKSEGISNESWHVKHPHLSETPWVLGIRGTLRATNVLDNANVTYYGCDMQCNGWGVLSTDGTKEAVHNIINTRAIIPGNVGYASGYGAYILGGVTSTFLGAELDVPDFCFAVGGNNRPITVGASSKENLEACGDRLLPLKEAMGGSFDGVEEKNSIIRSPRFIGMWHHNSTEPFNALPGTVFEAGDTAFLIKSGMPRPNGPEINCDACTIKAPRIVHLMETDDAGMGTRTHDGSWAPCKELWPPRPAPEERYDPAGESENTAHINLKNMTLSGDCFNTRTSGGQTLAISLDAVSLTGVVSSGFGSHRNFSYGLIHNEDGSLTCTDCEGRKYVTEKLDDLLFGKMPVTNYVPKTDDRGAFVYDESDDQCHPIDGKGIYYTDPRYLADMDITPAPAVNNGVQLKLANGSVWTVSGESFLNRFELAEGCSVIAPEGRSLRITVDGKDTLPAPGIYRGAIRISLI